MFLEKSWCFRAFSDVAKQFKAYVSVCTVHTLNDLKLFSSFLILFCRSFSFSILIFHCFLQWFFKSENAQLFSFHLILNYVTSNYLVLCGWCCELWARSVQLFNSSAKNKFMYFINNKHLQHVWQFHRCRLFLLLLLLLFF